MRLQGLASCHQLAVLQGHEGPVVFATFSPEGAKLVTASWDHTARLWDLARGEQLAVLRGHEGPVVSAAFSPDGAKLVTASEDCTVRLWDLASGHQLAVLQGHEGPVSCVTISPDGAKLVTVSRDHTARLWDLASGEQLAVLRGHVGPVVSAAFSPDGATLVTASRDETARLWDVATGQQLAVLQGHEGSIISAAFSRDGAKLVTASGDNAARLWALASGTASRGDMAWPWDLARGEQLAVLRGHEGPVVSAVFSPDGRKLVTTSWDNTARFWDLAGDKAGAGVFDLYDAAGAPGEPAAAELASAPVGPPPVPVPASPPSSLQREARERHRSRPPPAGRDQSPAARLDTGPGKIAFNPPERMKVGRAERIEVRLSRDIAAKLVEGLRGRGAPKIEAVEIAERMRVRLLGDDFAIASRSSEDQLVRDFGFTQWDFDITPKRSGRHFLRLLVTLRLQHEQAQELCDLPAFEREIAVQVAPVYSIVMFTRRNWQWLAVSIVLPLIAWLASGGEVAQRLKPYLTSVLDLLLRS